MEKEIEKVDTLVPNSDRAVTSAEKDEFGFVEIAQKIAPSLIEAANTDGMVIGIEGKWGSGKTSLLNFISSELESQHNEKLRVINLPPWLHGDASGLMGGLLSRMLPGLEEEELKRRPIKRLLSKRFATNIAKKMARYGAMAGRSVSPILKVTGVFVPAATLAGDATKQASNFLSLFKENSVLELKQQIADLLQKSELKFIVFLDDLDRLEPAQTIEVIRLIRSVADFPGVVYCLCYDRQVLTHALEHGLNVESGQSYLQKIVQQTFTMPLPEPFDLRISLSQKLENYYRAVNGRPLSPEEREDLRSVVDREGNRLQVPRDIATVLNGIKISYPHVRNEIYFPDLCWIQLIRAKKPELYFWIENYISTLSVVLTSNAAVSKSSRKKIGEELKSLLPDREDVSSTESIWLLSTYIPGITEKKKPEEFVFNNVSNKQIAALISKKRIGSPIHFRLYFAFATPKTVLPESQWQLLGKQALKDSDKLTKELVRLASTRRPIGGSWFVHVIERLEIEIEQIESVEYLVGWMFAICNGMDNILEVDNEFKPLIQSTGSTTTFIVQKIIKRIRAADSEKADEMISKLFVECPSISWLVGDFFRQELFDHGLTEAERARPYDFALTSQEIETSRKILESRLAEIQFTEKISQLPDLARFLYGWRDMSGGDKPKEWVNHFVQDDSNFLKILLALRNWVMSDKVYYPLKRQSVECFLDWDAVTERVQCLLNSADVDLSELSQQVSEAISRGRNE